jgi:hypothetical protein
MVNNDTAFASAFPAAMQKTSSFKRMAAVGTAPPGFTRNHDANSATFHHGKIASIQLK